jgi:hypothetical protein
MQDTIIPTTVLHNTNNIHLLCIDNIGISNDNVIKFNRFKQLSLNNLMHDIKNCKYSNIDKGNRPIIGQSSITPRPLQQPKYYKEWNGFHPYDIDIKDPQTAQYAQRILSTMLSKYNWVHSILLSTSGNGLHIYTFTQPLHTQQEATDEQCMEYYFDTYEHKMIIIWKALMLASKQAQQDNLQEIATQIHPINNTASRIYDGKKKQWSESNLIDVTSCRISQTLYVTSDSNAYINKHFALDKHNVQFNTAIYDTISKDHNINILKIKFDKLRNRSKSGNIVLQDDATYNTSDFKIVQAGDIASITPQNYDNKERYSMAYTLAFLYDLKSSTDIMYNQVLQLFLYMCSGNPKYSKERNQWSMIMKSAVSRHATNTCPIVFDSLRDLRTVHGFTIQINNTQSITNTEIIAEHNTIDIIEQFIMQDTNVDHMFSWKPTLQIELKQDEYIGTHTSKVLSHIKSNKVNYIVAKPGLGKTEFIKSITKLGKRILFVQPYTSIIKSKIEHSDLGMKCFYGDRHVDMSTAMHAVMTFDKFTKIDPDDATLLYDYIAIDESHLLTMSSYRGNVPADVIDMIKKVNTTVILMTGTPVAEHLFVDFATIVQFSKNEQRNKNLSYVICDNNADKLTKIAKHIAHNVSHNKKVIFPTNRGDNYVAKLDGAISMFLGGKHKSHYYKRSNGLYEFVNNIDKHGTLLDTDVLYCTNYLSVGVDINDVDEFDIIYDEYFTGQEIEQFNCRIRNTHINSYFYFAKNNTDGTPKNITLYEPLDISLTDDEQLNFRDIFLLHTNGDMTDKTLYDFFKYAFNAPYFIRNHQTGDVHVHNTSYKLHIFEEKWRKWSTQLNIVNATLKTYGYSTKFIQDAISDQLDMELAMQAAKDASKEYKELKNNKITQFLNILSNQDVFDEVLHISASNIIDSDRFELVQYDGNIKLLIADRKIYDTWRYRLRQLSRYYTRDTIFDIIYDTVYDTDNNSYKISRLVKIIDGARLFDNVYASNIVQSNTAILDGIINLCFKASNKTQYMSTDTIDNLCRHYAKMYINTSAPHAKSIAFISKIEQLSHRLFNVVTDKVGKDMYTLTTLQPFDSNYIITQNSLTDIMSVLFKSDTPKYTNNSNEISALVSRIIFDGGVVSKQHHDELHITHKLTESMFNVNDLNLYKDTDNLHHDNITTVTEQQTRTYSHIDNTVIADLIKYADSLSTK